jgi:hypothetical protein
MGSIGSTCTALPIYLGAGLVIRVGVKERFLPRDQGLMDTARHVINCILYPRLWSLMASFDAASGRCLPHHQTHIESSCMEFNGIL